MTTRHAPCFASTRAHTALLLPLTVSGVWAGAALSCSDLPDPPLCFPCKSACPADLQCDLEVHQCVPKDNPRACDELLGTSAGDGGVVGSAGGDPSTESGASTTGTDSGGGQSQSSGGGGGTRGGGTDSGSRAGAGGDSEECLEACEARILTERALDAVCTRGDVAIRFEAACICDPPGTVREVTWELHDPPAGLHLSEDGDLSVSLPDGVYRFDVEVTLSKEYHATDTFTLTVQNRCWLLFMTDDDADETVRVAATRLDVDDETIVLPSAGAADGSVTSFSVSPDGMFVTQNLQAAGATRLELVELGQRDVTPRTLDYAGAYVAHAFSNDSHWLAVVSSDGDDDAQELQLFDLTDGVSLADTKAIAYDSHLTWSATGDILYLGPGNSITGAAAVQQQAVTDGQLLERWEDPTTTLRQGETFHTIRVGDAGHLAVYSDRIVYGDWLQSDSFEQTSPQAISPNLQWAVHSYTATGMRIDPLAERYGPDHPFSTASDCELVRAFSGDGSRFLCAKQQSLFIYQTQETRGALTPIELNIPSGFQSTVLRMLFSERGNWLALVPTFQGLILASAADYATGVFDTPVLGPPEAADDNDWDFVFSPDEQWLVVQHGSTLRVAALHQEQPEFLPVEGEFSLPAVPGCSYDGYIDPDAWCGASRFRGNLLLSRAGQHVAFRDTQGVLRAVELGSRRVIRASTLAQPCVQAALTDCVQFQ